MKAESALRLNALVAFTYILHREILLTLLEKHLKKIIARFAANLSLIGLKIEFIRLKLWQFAYHILIKRT